MTTWKTGNGSYGAHYSAPKPKVGHSTSGFLISQDPTGFLLQQENVAKRERHGLFSQPLNLAPGDLYKDAEGICRLSQRTSPPNGWRSTRGCSRKWAPSCSRSPCQPTLETHTRTPSARTNST